MGITQALPFAALALAVIAFFVRDMSKSKPDETKQANPAVAYLMVAVLVGLAIAGGFMYQGYLAAALGFGIGAAAAALSYAVGLMKNQNQAGRTFPLAMGVAAIATLPLFPFEPAPLAAIFGAAAAAWLLSFNRAEEANHWGSRCALAVAGVGAANALGKSLPNGVEFSPHAGVIVGMILVVVGLVGSAVPKMRIGLAAALMAGAGWLLADRVFLSPDILVVVAGAAVLALVAHFMLNDENADTVRLVVTVVLWVAAGTMAFGYERGFGMALLFLVATGLLAIGGNQVGLNSVGPLGAIVLYRVFRENHLEATRAYDIGQHYAMIGILVGMCLPVLAQEWQREYAGKTKFFGGIAGAVWVPLLLAIPAAAGIMLGAKGVVGMLFGFGLAPIVEAMRGDRTAHPSSLALGLSAAMTLIYPWVAPFQDLDRDGKVKALGVIVGALFVIGIVIAVLSGALARPKDQKATS